MYTSRICLSCGAELPKHVIEKLNAPIEMLKLSRNALDCLRCQKIETVEQLANMSYRKIAQLPGVGDVTANEIEDRLRDYILNSVLQ